MGSFTYSTEEQFSGPWLLDHLALDDLHESVENIRAKFEQFREDEIARKLESSVETYGETGPAHEKKLREELERYSDRETIVKLKLSKSRYLEGKSVKEVVSHPELIDENPIGLEIQLNYDKLQASLDCNKGGIFSDRLYIRTSPENDDAARDAFVSLRKWVNKYRAPRWQRVWRGLAPGHWFVWFIVLYIVSSILITTEDRVEEQLRPVIVDLLAEGVTAEEQARALELLLRIQINEPEVAVANSLPSWYVVFALGSLVASVALSFCPRLVIGIGKGENLISRWRMWIKFVGVTAPSLLFASVLWPYVLGWIKEIL